MRRPRCEPLRGSLRLRAAIHDIDLYIAGVRGEPGTRRPGAALRHDAARRLQYPVATSAKPDEASAGITAAAAIPPMRMLGRAIESPGCSDPQLSIVSGAEPAAGSKSASSIRRPSRCDW
jgi:hypothetical protein